MVRFSNHMFHIALLSALVLAYAATSSLALPAASAVTMVSGAITGNDGKSIMLQVDFLPPAPYAISASAVVLIDGKSARISDLKPGILANAAISGGVITRVYARRPNNDSWGFVTSIDTKSITITSRSGDQSTFAVSSATKAFTFGKPATIGDLQPAMLVHVTYGDDNAALSIEAVRRDYLNYSGPIDKVNARSITILEQTGDPATLAINASTKITIDDKTKATTDLHSGLVAQATSEDGKTAVTISVTTKKDSKDKKPNSGSDGPQPAGGNKGTPPGGVSL